MRTAHRIEIVTAKAAEKRTANITNVNHVCVSTLERKSTLARRLALMVVTDLLPFSIVSGNGFRQFAIQEKIVSNISEIPSDRTLANSAMNDLYIMCKKGALETLQSSPPVISLQLDMSTSTNGNIPLITMVVSFMNDDFCIESFSISTEFFKRPHTGDAIAEKVIRVLTEYNLLDRKILMSGDHGKNVKKSFEKIPNALTYFDCIAHSVHLVLTVDLIKESEWSVADVVVKKIRKAHGKLCYQLYQLQEMFETSQRSDLIDYLKECEESLASYIADEEAPIFSFSDSDVECILNEEYQNHMSTHENFGSFKLQNATRWYSAYEMIHTYHKNFGMYKILSDVDTNSSLQDF